MIPLQLKIQGLYSYQEKQIIDFSKLTQSSIFGIFGSVGCGKSSILEAITFALYGKTDRLNLSGDNRNYNMMNLKSNELFIDFEFFAGNPQKKFRTVVSGKRNSKRFEDVKTLDRKGYIWDNKQWNPVELENIEKTIELSYENFKRTIIIPQGRFQEFLQLGNKDRTQMMKELFGLEKYELYYPVVGLENKNNSNLDTLKGKLQGLGEISKEQINSLKERANLLKSEVETLNKEIKKLGTQQKEFENLKTLFEKKAILEQKQKELKLQESEVVNLEKKLQAFEYCKLNFELLIKDKYNFQHELNEYNKLLDSENNKHNTNKENLETTEEQLKQLKPQIEGLDKLQEELKELDLIIKVTTFNDEINVLEKRVEKGKQILFDTEKKINAQKEQIKTKEQSLTDLKTNKPDLIKLSAIKEWFTKNQNIEQNLKEQITIINDAEFKQRKIQEEINDKVIHLSLGEFIDNIKPAYINSLLEKEIANLQKETQKIDIEREQHIINSKLSEYAEHLHDGQPCPLCGSENHPHIYSANEATQKLTELNNSKEKHSKQIKILTQANKELNDFISTYNYHTEILKTANAKYAQLNKDYTSHSEQNQWPEYKNIQAIETEIKKAQIVEKEIIQLEKEISTYRLNIEAEQKNYDNYKTGIDQLGHQISGKKHSIDTLKQQIVHLDFNTLAQETNLNLQEYKTSKTTQIKQIEIQAETLNKKLEKLKLERERLLESIRSKKQQIKVSSEKLKETTQLLNEKINNSNYQSIEQINEILNYSIYLESERKHIELFKQEKSANEQHLNDVIKDIKGKTYHSDKHKELNSNIDRLNLSFRVKDQELAVAIKEITSKENTLKTQKELLKEKEQLENRAENLKTLKQLFKGSGFVNYISTVHLQNICKAANERFFKLTGQKLSLEISEDNNFQVRDFMNSGKIRNVKTLSGGQTFQAALSLALALADSIQNKTNSKENFFFLDEGFGSLDKEALNVVFDTLKSLRKENRVVGVISHVEEMQHEIDTHLNIKFDEERGSLITSSV